MRSGTVCFPIISGMEWNDSFPNRLLGCSERRQERRRVAAGDLGVPGGDQVVVAVGFVAGVITDDAVDPLPVKDLQLWPQRDHLRRIIAEQLAMLCRKSIPGRQ